jgi:hypothetical protein
MLRVRLSYVTDTAENPAGGFAELMNKAAELGDAERAEAPYGYTTDPETGEPRPKRAAGRPRKPPTVDELREQAPAAAAEPPGDRAPALVKRSRRGKDAPQAQAEPVPQFREGQIARGVNQLYRKAGKIIRVADPEIGTAIIESTRKEAEDDVTVGDAWEELARANVRIRRFVMKALAGGAWGQLVMAHAPIAMAVLMKPAILRLIPFARVVEAVAEPDEDTPEGEGGLPGGMTAGDAQQMADLAQAQFAKMGLQVPPEVAAQMGQMAQSMAGGMMGGTAPRAYTRNQPRRPASRAERHGS